MGLKYFAYVFFFTKQSQKKVDPNFADRFGQSGRPKLLTESTRLRLNLNDHNHNHFTDYMKGFKLASRTLKTVRLVLKNILLLLYCKGVVFGVFGEY